MPDDGKGGVAVCRYSVRASWSADGVRFDRFEQHQADLSHVPGLVAELVGADASVVEIRRLPSKRQSEKEV